MSFGGGRGNGKDFNMDDFMNRAIMDENTGKPAQGMTLPNTLDMGNFNPVKMPGMPQYGPAENREHFFFGGKGLPM